jgi:hypothetical protein
VFSTSRQEVTKSVICEVDGCVGCGGKDRELFPSERRPRSRALALSKLRHGRLANIKAWGNSIIRKFIILEFDVSNTI